MDKIGIIGERDSVLGFMALGFSVCEVADAEAAGRALAALTTSGEYAVIFLGERYAASLEEELAQYKDLPLPAITVIPDGSESRGLGMASVKRAAERAVGADILWKENNRR